MREPVKFKVKDSTRYTIGPILEGHVADEIGNGDADAGAVECASGLDFGEYDVERQEIAYAQYVGTSIDGSIDVYYDYGADYYFFCPTQNDVGDYAVGDSVKVKDSVDSARFAEFHVKSENVYDLINEGSTTIAIPSGVDTDDFVKDVEKLIKDIAKDSGYKGLSFTSVIEGNILTLESK